jgi:diaminopimelate epimerase
MEFNKYHALGNDYIVIDPTKLNIELDQNLIYRICHRNYGVGSDGILYGPLDTNNCDFGLRIYNPDGSEAEKSGNGLRIFARYLWDCGYIKEKHFTVETPGGAVICQVSQDGKAVRVEMGTVSFNSTKIPIIGKPREVIYEQIEALDEIFTYSAATIGNPHCIIHCDNPTEELAKKFGPIIENDSRFPNRTNVQFMRIIDRNNIQIEIWERGAGYTLASGSSSTAAAAVAYKCGYCDNKITVHMPGGQLEIQITKTFSTEMNGPVSSVFTGSIDPVFFK